jgi:hypothetical protein
MNFRVGADQGEHVAVRVLDSDALDEYGWLTCEISVRAGAFSVVFGANLRTPDFPQFRQQLQQLYEDLQSPATFDTLEGQLSLTLSGDGNGHIDVKGEAEDKAGVGNLLKFHFEIGQTFLPAIIRDLDAISREHPSGSLR